MCEELQKIFSGRQDELFRKCAHIRNSWSTRRTISKMCPYSFIGTFVETRKIFLKGKKKERITISTLEDLERNYGYTNLRFNGDYNNIVSIELDLGGYGFDKIYPQILQNLSTFPILANNSILPALRYHSYDIVVDSGDELEIIYDVVQITNPVKNDQMGEILYKFTQFTGLELIPTQLAKIKIGFYNPTEKITVVSDQPLFNIFLHLDGHSLSLSLVSSKTQCLAIPYTYEYKFDPPVNFSTVETSMITFENPNASEVATSVAIFGESLNIARVQSDMIGMMFCQ